MGENRAALVKLGQIIEQLECLVDVRYDRAGLALEAVRLPRIRRLDA